MLESMAATEEEFLASLRLMPIEYLKAKGYAQEHGRNLSCQSWLTVRSLNSAVLA